MDRRRFVTALLLALFLTPALLRAEAPDSSVLLDGLIDRVFSLFEAPRGQRPMALVADLKLVGGEGLPKEAIGATASLCLEAPRRAKLTVTLRNATYTICQDDQVLWISAPGFAAVGSNDVPKFASDPKSLEPVTLADLAIPLSRREVSIYAMLLSTSAQAVEGTKQAVLTVKPKESLTQLLSLPPATLAVTLKPDDHLPTRLVLKSGVMQAEVEVTNARLSDKLDADTWKLKPGPHDKVERVALVHLTKFIQIALSNLRDKIQPLPPATGAKHLVASSGAGRLEIWDGTRVLWLKGTPAEMGKQHGELLRNEIRDVKDRIVYGVGVGSSFPKGRWFFGEIEAAHARLAPFISQRTYEEIDALADAAWIDRREMRLANFFPELFHCTGFAIAGAATKDGKLYHGRVLDYLRGVGLEQNAVVMVVRPDKGNAWVNLSYAGFVGSISAMNEKQISIGEMGGRGEGNWDGKPMAQLMREVMENASTLDEAVEIFRKGPRTCEYYYVIADGKTGKSVAIKGTPTIFETVGPGDPHPQLPRPVKDTVLLSADKRYNALVDRVEAGYGKFDADSARALMEPPVCMNSNIQSVLFAPQSLDFWVANADSQNVASKTRYTKYNLKELLEAKPSAPPKKKEPTLLEKVLGVFE